MKALAMAKGNQRLLFNDGWHFAKSSLAAEDSSGLDFSPVDLPHDWLIYDTSNLYENSIGWYRKTLVCETGDTSRRFLRFDGVYMDSALYVNGRRIGEWKYGYSSFEFDITEALREGENELLMKVVHQSPNSRWYSGAGIYRNVWLKISGPHYIETDGIYATIAQQDSGEWRVEMDTELQVGGHYSDGGESGGEGIVPSAHASMAAGAEGAALAGLSSAPVAALFVTHAISCGEEIVASVCGRRIQLTNDGKDDEAKRSRGDARQIDRQGLVLRNPLLWSTDEPQLYRLTTTLQAIRHGADGEEAMEVVETVTQNLGFRSIVLDPVKGMLLNGKSFKINGVCEHHDLGALGAAFNVEAQRWRLGLLKEMGVNGIRAAHNMPAPELMDLADEMGFVVVSEAFDMWERSKTPYDYARFFPKWMPRDVQSWVRRDRNHPSLLMWSIGNEIYDTHADERGQEVTRMLMAEVLKHDPRGNAPVTIGSNYMPWENAQKCADIVKLAGYNYAEKYYARHHEQHPDWIIYGSETASVVQSRGVYHFPYEAGILADDDEQCSALGNSTTSWGAKSPEACIIAERDTRFSLGQFLWTGFDYIGEPTPYHTKNSYFGQIDTAGFKKDSFYIYQAAWTDYKKAPMVHILPYWDFNEGQMIDVRVCSNAPRVELLFNGESVGVFDIDHAHGAQLVAWWKLPYREGELKALAYDENGAVIASDVKRSFGDASQIVLKPHKETLVANGIDLVFLEIGMKDEDGNPVENAASRVEVSVGGAGRLVGLDNGDSTDYDPYKGISRRLFNGKLMAMIASTLEEGDITVQVSSPGLESREVKLAAHPAADGCNWEADGSIPLAGGSNVETGSGNRLSGESSGEAGGLQGVSANARNGELPLVLGAQGEVPIRKLEIVSESGQRFDAANTKKHVSVKLHPANATYRDVEWKVVNDAGIASTIAKVEADGETAKLIALGDGSFRLRCMSRNGGSNTRMISQLEFHVEGLGTAFKNPYGFISAGLYDDHRGELGNGNERGVATSRDGVTAVGFAEIDFGAYGSDLITLPIFALSDEAYGLEIWEGPPGEAGSELLADAIYQKPSRWNVYQEETYRLSRRLRGVTSLWLVTRQKLHIKGFVFEEQNGGLAQNFAADCDRIYGDAYTIAERYVEGIGNNVSLAFNGLDFGVGGVSRLVLCGHSPIDKNTIHIQFSGPNGDTRQLVEFTESDGYVERAFQLDPINGEQDVTFIFLPGSQFDFGWFRFE